MGWLAQIVEKIAPGIAARRVASQARLESSKRLYEAVTSTNYRPRRGGTSSADATMNSARGRLWEYARWLDENHDLATGALDDLVSNIVGTGVGIEPMVRDKSGNQIDQINDNLRALWAKFWERPEVTGEIPGRELERLICRTWLRDGELFIQHMTAASIEYATGVPYALAPLEADFVPWELINNRDNVIHGVVKNKLGRPTYYHVYKSHPGNSATSSAITGLNLETVQIPAGNMSHLKFVRRFHQTRGTSLFHSVFTRLDDLKDYEESERIAARIAASFSAYIKKGSDYDTSVDATTNDRAFKVSPGMVFDNLLPGEDIGTIDANRPNNNVGNYIATQERRIASGLGSRYSSIARDYNGTYSAQRQELVEGAVHYRRLFSYLADQFYLPVWRRFIDAARLSGALRIPKGVDLDSLYKPELRAPSLPWIDPLKEVQAMQGAIDYGLRSRPQCIRDLGGDPQQVDAQIEADTFEKAEDKAAAAATQEPEQSGDSQDEEKAA